MLAMVLKLARVVANHSQRCSLLLGRAWLPNVGIPYCIYGYKCNKSSFEQYYGLKVAFIPASGSVLPFQRAVREKSHRALSESSIVSLAQHSPTFTSRAHRQRPVLPIASRQLSRTLSPITPSTGLPGSDRNDARHPAMRAPGAPHRSVPAGRP